MRPLRTTRKSARLVTVAAASCAVAMLALTGCGDDDKGGPGIPPPSLPELSPPSLKPLTLPPLDLPPKPTSSGSGSPSGASSTASSAATGQPSADSTKLGPVDLRTVGVCVGRSATTQKLIKVPCSQEHVGEIAVIFTLPDSMNPSSATYKDYTTAKCDELVRPIINRQPDPGNLTNVPSAPTEKSWAEDNDRTLSCIVTIKGTTKLTGPLVK